MSKDRISVTIDPDLVELAEQAVADGRARSVSAFINDALRERERRQRRAREALTAMVREHELADPEAYQAARARAERMVAARTAGRAGEDGSGAAA